MYLPLDWHVTHCPASLHTAPVYSLDLCLVTVCLSVRPVSPLLEPPIDFYGREEAQDHPPPEVTLFGASSY